MKRASADLRRARKRLKELQHPRKGQLTLGAKSIAHELADRLAREIAEELGEGPLAKVIREALQVKLVEGLGRGEHTFGVFLSPVERQIPEMEKHITILRVKAITKGGTAPPAEAYLEAQEDGWTLDTLPYVPHRSKAKIIQELAPRVDVDEVREKHTKLKARHRRALKGHGVKEFREPSAPLGRTVRLDVQRTTLRAEIGIIEGLTPSWTPILRRMVATLYKDQEGWADRLFDPQDRKFRHLPDLEVASREDVASAEAFAERVAP